MAVAAFPTIHCMLTRKNENCTDEERIAAASVLSGAGFKLYIYFTTFCAGTSLYERAKAIKILNITRPTVDSAFCDLVNNSFLEKIDDKSYNFFTSPERKNL